jgi:hypothetical protein
VGVDHQDPQRLSDVKTAHGLDVEVRRRAVRVRQLVVIGLRDRGRACEGVGRQSEQRGGETRSTAREMVRQHEV